MATTLNKVITRNADNTINTSTNYSELNVKASNLTNNLVSHLEAQITTMEGAMQAKEGAVDVKIASLASVGTSTYTTPYLDRSLSMMSKAEFNAVAAERRANRAGSGFDEFGKHYAGIPNVNEGIVCEYAISNSFSIGRGDGYENTGVSKTWNPSISINGTFSQIKYINADNNIKAAILLLPPAPTVLPYTATLTQQQIDSGVIKHADASNSGLIVNGKFNTDTSGWTAQGTGTTFTSVGGVGSLTTTSQYWFALQIITGLVIGKKYILEGEILSEASTNKSGIYIKNSSNATYTSKIGLGKAYLEFTPTETSARVWLYGDVAGTYTFDNIAVFPADAISRSDLPFIESWHEDISEKDFVYPLGNVQYLGTTGDCGTTVAGTFAGYGTYSLLSDTWQADNTLVGKGYVWSTLSDANKKAFVANPENNCYLDGDKVIQVRYRARVVMGLGDSWASPLNAYSWFGYSSPLSTQIKAKGKLPSSNDYLVSLYAEGGYVGGVTTTKDILLIGSDYGVYGASNNGVLATQVGYEGKCYALPIALVHRRNQGAYHPVYNANGTKLASDGLPWYSTTVPFTSIADCFTDSKLLSTSGYIGTTTGRADGIFYDQVHEGDITDLRVNSRGMNDYTRTMDKWFAKLQDSTYRGTEGENMFVKYASRDTDGTSHNVINPELSTTIFGVESGMNITIISIRADLSSVVYSRRVVSTVAGAITLDSNIVRGSGGYILSVRSTRTKSNTLTHTDIIGSPTNYPASWKQSGVSGVPLIVAEDGTSLLPTGTTGSDGLAVFKLSHKANATPLQVLKSTDSGATWTALTVTTHYTFSTSTNAITFTAGNIPLVADLVRVTYKTHTNMAVPAVNSEVLDIGEIMATSLANTTNGALYLAQSLIGKILTSVAYPYQVNAGKVSGYRLINSIFSTTALEGAMVHSNIVLAGAITYPAVKVFPYLTRSNGKAYLQLVFKEMKYNGSSWGDDSKFSIVDNVSTTTDTNGATVLIGQKRVELPYFIGAAE